ncbi:MAG: L,D-transpeptidase [Phormidesmis sp.]
MPYLSLRYRKIAVKALTACLGGMLVGSVNAASASAQMTPAELLNAVNSRASATPARTLLDLFEVPASEVPVPASEVPADSTVLTPSAVQPAAEQTLRLLLSLSDRTVYVYRGEVLETSYPVAIGRPGWETPTGEFEVFSQVVEPGWTNPITGESMAPGLDNPLGDRWIAFWTDGLNSIGFHGTPNRDSVGQAASHGCIRMYNEDVRELFEMVSLGTPVLVEP